MEQTAHGARLQSREAAEPRGGRIGVAYDWGFSVQLVLTSAASLAGVPFGGQALPLPVSLGMLAVAGGSFALGEGLRRGSGLAWRIQIGAHSLLALSGAAMLPLVITAVRNGSFGVVYTFFLLLVVSAVEIWLLLQPGSRQWYGKVDRRAALARHSGGWLIGTVIWGIIGGVLQTFAATVWR